MTIRFPLALTSLLAVIAAAAAAAAPGAADAQILTPPPARGPVIGIADQKPDFLSDPRFLKLRLTHARVSVPWDVLKTPDQVTRLETWLDAARENGVQPLVTFDRSSRPGQGR